MFTKGAGEGFVWVKTQSVIIYGCYISPNIKLEAITNFKLLLRTDMKKTEKEIVPTMNTSKKSRDRM